MTSCPRCKGLLFWETDSWGKFLTCLQCGYAREQLSPGLLLDINDDPELGRPRLRRRRATHGGQRL